MVVDKLLPNSSFLDSGEDYDRTLDLQKALWKTHNQSHEGWGKYILIPWPPDGQDKNYTCNCLMGSIKLQLIYMMICARYDIFHILHIMCHAKGIFSII